MTAVTQALVALGSSLAFGGRPPAALVAAAMDAITGLGVSAGRSRLWRSPAWPPGGPDYVNAVMALGTALDPEVLLAALHDIEVGFGREREVRWGPRTLDLDLLAWGDAVRPDAATWERWRGLDPDRQGREAPEGLILPHPRVQDRGFVLLPLLDVAPGWRHPVLGLGIREMLEGLPPAAREGVEPLDHD